MVDGTVFPVTTKENPVTCSIWENHVKREQPSKVAFDLIFIRFDSWLSVGKSCTRVERCRKGACEKRLRPRCPSSPFSSATVWLPSFTRLLLFEFSILFRYHDDRLSASRPHLSFPFLFHFLVSLQWLSSSRLLDSFWYFSLLHHSSTLHFYLRFFFLATVIRASDLCSSVFTTVSYQIFILRSRHLQHIVFQMRFEVLLAFWLSDIVPV